MPVTTRGQAKKLLDEQLTVLRNVCVGNDETVDFVQVQITPSETGEGTHIRWVYPTPSPEDTPQKLSTPSSSATDESPPIRTPTLQQGESSEHCDIKTPEPTPPATPAAPKPLRRTYKTGAANNAGECLYFWRRPDEDIETAIRRNVEMYYQEAAQRDAENRRRIRDFVQAHPVPLSKDGDTELFNRENSAWNSDPFL